MESAINTLEHRGLDRVLAQGPGGFARVVALSVIALNIHRIGLLLRMQTRKRQRCLTATPQGQDNPEPARRGNKS